MFQRGRTLRTDDSDVTHMTSILFTSRLVSSQKKWSVLGVSDSVRCNSRKVKLIKEFWGVRRVRKMVLALIRKTPEVRTFYYRSKSYKTRVVQPCTTYNIYHKDRQGNKEGTFKSHKRKAFENCFRMKYQFSSSVISPLCVLKFCTFLKRKITCTGTCNFWKQISRKWKRLVKRKLHLYELMNFLTSRKIWKMVLYPYNPKEVTLLSLILVLNFKLSETRSLILGDIVSKLYIETKVMWKKDS